MLSLVKVDRDDGQSDLFPNLKVFGPKDLRNYYEETKRIILKQGRRNQTEGDAAAAGGGDGGVGANQPPLSSMSLNEKIDNGENHTSLSTKAFSLQHFEPRHRRSMIRCVLNGFHSDNDINDKSTSKIFSKVEFKERLRSVDRKRRWRMTRSLLFGDNFVLGTGNDEQQEEQKYWWESGIIKEEEAPGLVRTIREYMDTWESNVPPAQGQRKINEINIDPQKFLSRLARGRTYKGDFRSLLDDYVITSNTSGKDKLIALYDKIRNESKRLSWEETNRREVELLRLFIDELEEDARANNSDSSSAANKGSMTLVRSIEQILLLRSICDLDIFSSALASRPALSSNDSPSVDDAGRSLGKKGEQDLETFLIEKHLGGGTNSSNLHFNSRVLSPVWVRPKNKNRRNIKQKCRYVLEIPRLADSENSSNTRNSSETNTNGFISQGTTSEFDAMVVHVRKTNDISEGSTLPIMVIQEVWEAKATLDPSALIDALDKKARSLQKILCHKKSNVINIADPSATRDCRAIGSLADQEGKIKADNHGVSLVVLPLLESKEKVYSKNINETNIVGSNTANPPSPMVYRVGIEPPEDCGSDQLIPQIGVFANKMIDTRAAARRIQTIVYERLLETDLTTVKRVIRRHEGVFDEETDIHCNRLVRERSVEIVDHILRLIDTLRPLVVVEVSASDRLEYQV